MLSYILIRNFTIIEYLELELDHGMTTLTGETGAGKSILIDAIGLVLGDRTDSRVVHPNADKAEITASFDLEKLPATLDWLVAHDLEAEDNVCTIRRIITQEGRSRAYIGGSPTTLQMLKELGQQLVDIHGQHAHQSLLNRDTQRNLLDLHANQQDLLEKLANTYHRWSSLKSELQAIEENDNARQERLDLINFQFQELETAAPEPDEVNKLEEEHQRLSHATHLLENVQNAYAHIFESEPDANGLLSQAITALEHAADFDKQITQPLELLSNAQIEIQEAATELRRYTDSLKIDPAGLDEISSRLALLQSLARKHRCTPDSLQSRLKALRTEREQLLNRDEHLGKLQSQLETAKDEYWKLYKQVSNGRAKAAKILSQAVTQAMQKMGMSEGHFAILVKTASNPLPTVHGPDRVEFQVTVNRGQPLRPLAKVASGGELSRISLALQLAAKQDQRIPILVFDEVDSGIGGGIAEVVGRMLRQLGNDRQILCVTHLPQVAAQAHHQLAVRKINADQTTQTKIMPLKTEHARIEELARMLGGVDITPRSQAHAEEMLWSAQQE